MTWFAVVGVWFFFTNKIYGFTILNTSVTYFNNDAKKTQFIDKVLLKNS